MARPIHSHYDNLKVARSAPVEVIRAAYRALAKQYHPDQNPSPDAARVMKLLNAAWEVLGDPVQRAQHDVWIASQEADQREREHVNTRHSGRGNDSASDAPPTAWAQRWRGVNGKTLAALGAVLLAVVVTLLWVVMPSAAHWAPNAATAAPATGAR
jgi:curved DNA-binding protein CbpA